MQLADYQAQVQDLLHDPSAQVWELTQLTDYINEARERVCVDTWCLRTIIGTDDSSITFTQGTEFINPQTFLPSQYGPVLIGCLGITIVINNRRRALRYAPYTWLSANYRIYSNVQRWPEYWSVVSPTQYVIEPVCNATYPAEFDIAVTPTSLSGQQGETDQVPVPFQTAVQYFAAYKAKVNQQQLQEAQLYLGLYGTEIRRLRSAFGPRIQPHPRGR